MSLYKRKILPPEITEEILSRLPPKSLGRFKSVSKTWYSLISDPKFIKTHIGHQKTTKLLLHSTVGPLYSLDISALVDLSATVKEVIFPSSPLMEWKRIWGSCNGLVLAEDKNNLFLMNTTTKELWKVPRNPFALPIKHCVNFVVMTGFGYDPSTDDYKIVSIDRQVLIHGRSCSDMFVSVYSLRGNSWKKLPNAPYHQLRIYPFPGALVNHNLHWLTSTRSRCSTVIAFSLENEEFNEIQGPDSIQNAKARSYNPLVFRGKLAILRCDSGYNLWVMEEYGVGKSWTKVCFFHEEDERYGMPVCLVEGSDWDIVLGDFRDDGLVRVYNIDESGSRKVQIDGVTSAFSVRGTYAETLESPAKYIRTAP